MNLPKLPLKAVYDRECGTPDALYMIQPLSDGSVRTYTWLQAMDQARRMASYLVSLELPPQSNIALISENCAHFIICELAIWMAGHVTVAIVPTETADGVAYILDQSDARLVFIGKLRSLAEMAPGVPAAIPKIALPLATDSQPDAWDGIVSRYDPITDHPVRDAEEPAIIIYTSGSTGRPKGVVHSFRAAAIVGEGLSKKAYTGSDDRVLSFLPLAHGLERGYIEFGSFYADTRIYFSHSRQTFYDDLRRARPTVFLAVPRLWLKYQSVILQDHPPEELERMLNSPDTAASVKHEVLGRLGFSELRRAYSGSAPMPAELISWYSRLGIEILEGYGTTEDMMVSHLSTPEKHRVGYVGVPWEGVEARISEEGEVLIKTPGIMLGYYRQPDLTAATFTDDGFYRTGDTGEYSSDGLLKITGRIKELFKTSKGKFVAPAPIENRLNASPLIEMSCVSGRGQSAAYAAVQLSERFRHSIESNPQERESLQAELTTLLDRINGELAHQEQLQFLLIASDEWTISNGFLTGSQKIRRQFVETTYAPHLAEWYASGQKVIWQ